MDEVIWVRATPEFVHQVCVKLIENGGAHKHSCNLKPVSTNYGFHHHIFVCFSKYIFEMKKLKTHVQRSEWNCEEIFSPNAYFLMWLIKWRCQQIKKKETIFCDKISFVGMSICSKFKHYSQGSFVLLLFYGGSLVTSWFWKNLMSLFGCFSFWAPTHFQEVICPRSCPEQNFSQLWTWKKPFIQLKKSHADYKYWNVGGVYHKTITCEQQWASNWFVLNWSTFHNLCGTKKHVKVIMILILTFMLRMFQSFVARPKRNKNNRFYSPSSFLNTTGLSQNQLWAPVKKTSLVKCW